MYTFRKNVLDFFKQASVFVLKTLKCKTLGRKIRFSKKVKFFHVEEIHCFYTKILQCEPFEKIFNSDNFKNLTTKFPCVKYIKLYS